MKTFHQWIESKDYLDTVEEMIISYYIQNPTLKPGELARLIKAKGYTIGFGLDNPGLNMVVRTLAKWRRLGKPQIKNRLFPGEYKAKSIYNYPNTSGKPAPLEPGWKSEFENWLLAQRMAQTQGIQRSNKYYQRIGLELPKK
jgi:hypothetical protein